MGDRIYQVRSASPQQIVRYLGLFTSTAPLVWVMQSSQIQPITPATSVLAQSSAAANRVSTNGKQGWVWQNVNIQGMGYVTGLVIHGRSPHNVYIRTDVGGAYRYDRKHNQWVPLMEMLPRGGGIGVESVAIDTGVPNRVLAVISYQHSPAKDGNNMKYKESGEVLISDNQGKTWQPTGLAKHNINLGANSAYRSDTGERLMVDPHKPGLMYFATRRDGLWKKDGALSPWNKVTGGLPDPSGNNNDIPGFTFVAFDQNTGKPGNTTQTIYLGIHGSGVWRSSDGGTSWQNINGSNNPLRGVVAADGTLYVSFGTWGKNGTKTTGGLRKYKNGTWTDIHPDGTDRVYSAVTVQPDRPDTIMAISGELVYRSTNGGKNWNKQTMSMNAYNHSRPLIPANPSAPGYYTENSASGGAAAIVIDPGNPRQVWWTNGYGVARTDDVTAPNPVYNWQMNNLEELLVYMVRVPPKKGGADLLSAVADMIGFRHVSRHQVPHTKFAPAQLPINPAYKWANPNWQVYPVPFPHVASATSLDYSYNNPDHAAIIGFHQWQSNWSVHGTTKDNGQTWQAFPSIPTENLWKGDKSGQQPVVPQGGQIAMSPTNPQNMVWAPTWGPWPHYTTDGGKTWKLAENQDHGPKPQPYDPKNNDHTHYKNLPKSWANNISPWVSAKILAADRQDPQGKTFYYFDGATFYYSSDGGANWKKGAEGKFPGWKIHPTIVPNPTQQGDVWMSFARNPEDVNGNKLYRSTDGGKNFVVVASVDTCEYITFGKGDAPKNPYIYIFGRVGGAKQDAMYKSSDMGKNWSMISDPSTQQFYGIQHMEADMRSPNLLYIARSGRGIMVGEAVGKK